MENNEESFLKDIATSNRSSSFVYGFIDLFSGYGESWNWGFGMDETSEKSYSAPPLKLEASEHVYEAKANNSDRKSEPFEMQETKQGSLVSQTAKLDTLGENGEESNKSMSSSCSSGSHVEELVGSGNESEKEVNMVNTVYCFSLSV